MAKHSLTIAPFLLLLVAGQGAAAPQNFADRNVVHLKSGPLDPLTQSISQQAQPPQGTDQEQEEGEDYFIVQFQDRVTKADREDLADRSLTVIEYLPHDSYLVRGRQTDALEMEQQNTVRAVALLPAETRIDPDLRLQAFAEALPPQEIIIVMFPGADTIGVSLEVARTGSVVQEWEPGAERMTVLANSAQINQLLQLKHVQWIQRVPTMTMRNNTTAWVIQSNSNNSTPAWDNGILGEGAVIGHIDGPLDIDSCYFEDPVNNTPGPNHRKVVSIRGGGSPDSHGTHTAGTALGDQEPVNGSTSNRGMAPKAKISHTANSQVSGTNLATRLEEQFNDGARLFTNSWGNDFTTAYDLWAQDIDNFVWQNQEALPMWAVTNGSSLRNPENAKNLLAVGASLQANNQSSFCSGGAGPTSDGRRKPEIYAPGCSIVSASTANCGLSTQSGTSMASPAIAGAGALIYEYFLDGWYPSGSPNAADSFEPSGALMKSMIIGGGLNMTGIGGFPSNTEGWGRLNLERTMFFSGDNRKLVVHDIPRQEGFTGPDEVHTYHFDLVGTNPSLELCLAFPDKQGSLNTNFAPVNDIDLELTTPSGLIYRGNVFANEESNTGGSFDAVNNLERIKIKDPELGFYTARVIATNMTTEKNQSYGLVITGDIETDNPGTFEQYGTGLAGTGGFIPDLAGDGQPDIGNSFTLDITNTLGSVNGEIWLGLSRTSLPFLGGTLLVAPPWTRIPVAFGGNPGEAGGGSLSLVGSLPDDPIIVGAALDFQVLVFDAGAVRGIAMSQGLEAIIGAR